MPDDNPIHKTAMEILAKSLEQFKLPNALTSFQEEELKHMAKLLWAIQVLLKEVLDDMAVLGNVHDLTQRIECIERMLACSKGVLTSTEVMEYLDIGKTHLYHLVRDEGLPTFKPSGKQMFFKVEDVVNWVVTHPNSRADRLIDKTGLIKPHEP